MAAREACRFPGGVPVKSGHSTRKNSPKIKELKYDDADPARSFRPGILPYMKRLVEGGGIDPVQFSRMPLRSLSVRGRRRYCRGVLSPATIRTSVGRPALSLSRISSGNVLRSATTSAAK